MFLANAPSTESEASWVVRQLPALSVSVANTLRARTTSPSAAVGGHGVRLDAIRRTVALVDAYVWQRDPVLLAVDPSGDRMDAAACGASQVQPIAGGHSERVARLATRIAARMGWRGPQLATMYLAGLLHDVGKVGVDARILHKPGKLTEWEYDQIRTHPEVGYQMLLDIEPLSDVLPAVLHHHEQWNGRGYPHGLSGEAIPPIARIVAVADAHDAMTNDRPYRNGMPKAQVRRIFEDGASVYWDLVVVEAYYKAIGDDRV